MNRKLVLRIVLGSLLSTGLLVAQTRPVRNISPRRHPNLAAAQRITERAYERVVAAQQANEFDLQGHAQKAKELLDQANRELKLAAHAANER